MIRDDNAQSRPQLEGCGRVSNKRFWGLETLVPIVATKGREICSVITAPMLTPACLTQDEG